MLRLARLENARLGQHVHQAMNHNADPSAQSHPVSTHESASSKVQIALLEQRIAALVQVLR